MGGNREIDPLATLRRRTIPLSRLASAIFDVFGSVQSFAGFNRSFPSVTGERRGFKSERLGSVLTTKVAKCTKRRFSSGDGLRVLERSGWFE